MTPPPRRRVGVHRLDTAAIGAAYRRIVGPPRIPAIRPVNLSPLARDLDKLPEGTPGPELLKLARKHRKP